MTLAAPTRHLIAALLAACVLLLGFAAQAPALHAALCDTRHSHPHAATDCETSTAPRLVGVADDRSDETANTAHAESHGHTDAADAKHVCAVTLFAGGCETPVAFSLCPPTQLHADGVASFTELLLARTPRGPERVCGPPALA